MFASVHAFFPLFFCYFISTDDVIVVKYVRNFFDLTVVSHQYDSQRPSD